jgi:hypothetical protein
MAPVVAAILNVLLSKIANKKKKKGEQEVNIEIPSDGGGGGISDQLYMNSSQSSLGSMGKWQPTQSMNSATRKRWGT